MTRIYLSAAEASADLYASHLARALKQKHPDWEISGMVRELSRAAGVKLRVLPEGLDLIGGLEILRSLSKVKKKMEELKQDIAAVEPDIFVPFDLPGFHSRLLPLVRPYVRKILYLIPPMVYGRKKNRAVQLKPFVDACVVIYPFDLSFYQEAGIPVYFYGHPLLELLPECHLKEPEFVLLLPGSREKELAYFVPFFLAVVRFFLTRYPEKKFHMVFASLQDQEKFSKMIADSHLPVSFSSGDLYARLEKSFCALAVSGTVTLEVALCGVPQIIVYRISKITAFLAKKFVLAIHQIGLPNLILGQAIVPERMGSSLDAAKIAQEIGELLKNPAGQSQQKELCHRLREKLAGSGQVWDRVVTLMETL